MMTKVFRVPSTTLAVYVVLGPRVRAKDSLKVRYWSPACRRRDDMSWRSGRQCVWMLGQLFLVYREGLQRELVGTSFYVQLSVQHVDELGLAFVV